MVTKREGYRLDGLILKGIGGFYYVETADKIVECKAKGIFRQKKLSPLVGDRVSICVDMNGKGLIEEIKPRKNEFLRPPLANLDQLFLVVSSCEPEPNLFVIDKLLTIAEYKGIQSLIVLTKEDLKRDETVAKVYRHAGYQVLSVSNIGTKSGKVLLPYLEGKITALTGNTGVGKSSLLNSMMEGLNLETSHISQKLGRGRHTTRHVELYQVEGKSGTYVADTPGFSTVELNQYDIILKDKLQYCFREFEPFLGKCKFTGCSHTAEKGCAVLEALNRGEIEPSRHQSYVQLYEAAKQIKEWELK